MNRIKDFFRKLDNLINTGYWQLAEEKTLKRKSYREINLFVKKLYLFELAGSSKEEVQNFLKEFIIEQEAISPKNMVYIFTHLENNYLTEEIAEMIIERVKMDKTSPKPRAKQLIKLMKATGLIFIIDLFDNEYYGKGEEYSLNLLYQVTQSTCALQILANANERGYIKYFSFGDGKNLLEKEKAIKILNLLTISIRTFGINEKIKKEFSENLSKIVFG